MIRMRVLVDTNVILDLVHDDPVWGDWSDRQLTKLQSGGFLTNPMIYAELCAGAHSVAEVDAVLAELRLEYRELPREVLFLASKVFLKYRKQGGIKTAPMPDFFIGAHAEILGVAILTRDQGRYRSYFPSVPLICP